MLKKLLYGLKQSFRAGFGQFMKSMIAFSYCQSNSDHTLFLERQLGKISTLIIYVDDMVITMNDREERKAQHRYLSDEFEIKHLSPLKYFLRLKYLDLQRNLYIPKKVCLKFFARNWHVNVSTN